MEKLSSRMLTTARLVMDALFAALYIVLACFITVKLPFIEFSLASLPIVLCALLFGPVDAMLVALVGSFLEQLLSPYGLSPTMPLWMLPPILQGLAVGLFALLLPVIRRKGTNLHKSITLVTVILIGEVILTTANTASLYLDGMIMQYPVKALHLILLPRLLNCLARTVCNCVVILLLFSPIQKIFSMRKNS